MTCALRWNLAAAFPSHVLQAFLARNMHIKQFKSIPLADLELVLPEKKIFVPPTVLLQLAVTAVLGTVAVLSTLRQVCLHN